MNTLASLLNLAGTDLLIILLIVLLLFGAKKLPELARGMGQAFREFNKAKDDFEKEISRPAEDVTIRKPAEQQPHEPEPPQTTATQPSTPEAHPAESRPV